MAGGLSGEIFVNHEAVMRCSEEFANAAAGLEASHTAIAAVHEELSGEWVGNAGTYFIAVSSETLTSMSDSALELESLASRFASANRGFLDTDQGLSQSLKGE